MATTLTTESLDLFEKIVMDVFSVDTLPRGSCLDYVLKINKNDGKVDVEYEPWEDRIPDFIYNKE